jgi:homoserine kinase
MLELRVPATSANLGPGFDCLGLALGLYDIFYAEAAEDICIEGVEEAYNNPGNLFVKAFQAAGGRGVHVRFQADIPAARGLGSSAALRAAGAAAGFLFSRGDIAAQELFQLTAHLEGHPDNVASVVFGGFTASMKKKDNTFLTRRLVLSSSWRFTVLIPDVEVRTAQARAVLPESYPRAIAAGNSAHAVLLCQALTSGDLELLKEAAVDQLHEPYRGRLIPSYPEIKEITQRDTGGVLLISGSGSSCLLISRTSLSQNAIAEISRQKGHWAARELPAAQGLAIRKDQIWKTII